MPIHTYQDALNYIYSFIDPARKPATSIDEATRALERVRALLYAVGDPQVGVATVVVAGTKGKGSSCAILESILRAAGLRVGLWTSPHLSSYRERIQVNRTMISHADLIRLTAHIQPLVAAFDPQPYGPPSTFDLTLALGLHHFAERQVDLAVIEVGLGGRFDTTNVLTPLVSLISSISYDHMAFLGTTLSEIADNKAGIMKPGVPVVTVPQRPGAATVLVREAQQVGTELYVAEEQGLRGQEATLPYPTQPAPGRLRGGFQHENARLALGAAMLLGQRGYEIGSGAMAKGLATAQWLGRFEVVGGSPSILLDGAHNCDSAQKLMTAIRAELTYGRMILVLGTSRDKDIAGIAAALVPHASAVVITRSIHPRAMEMDRIAAIVRPHLRGSMELVADIGDALMHAQALAAPNDLICVTGSLFVVGAAREILGLAEAD